MLNTKVLRFSVHYKVVYLTSLRDFKFLRYQYQLHFFKYVTDFFITLKPFYLPNSVMYHICP